MAAHDAAVKYVGGKKVAGATFKVKCQCGYVGGYVAWAAGQAEAVAHNEKAGA